VTLDEATDEAVLAIRHAQQAQAWTANIIGGFEKALTDAGLLKTLHRPPAICFLDITGYTRLTTSVATRRPRPTWLSGWADLSLEARSRAAVGR
jgi:hypothetical protein